jgi:hypothetical protein
MLHLCGLCFLFCYMFPTTTVFVHFHSKGVVWKRLFSCLQHSHLMISLFDYGRAVGREVWNHPVYSYMPLVGDL